MKTKDINVKESDTLPQLTDKQYKFVSGKLEGLSNAEAYRRAYEGTTTKPESIWRRAAEVSSNSKVSAWLEHARQEAVSKLVSEATYTLETHLSELTAIQTMAIKAGQHQVAANCAHLKGKAVNLYTERKEINVNNKTDMALIDKLGSLLGHDVARQAASNMGYKMEEKHLDS